MLPPKIGHSAGPIAKILAVIVIYKMRPSDSQTVQTLLVAAEEASRSGLDLGILIWDNTPGGQDTEEIPAGARYVASPDNPGLARAYNRGLAIAFEEGYEWLLTLDQDTALPPEFLVRVIQIAREIETTPSIAAIVPTIKGGLGALSPYWISWTGYPRFFNEGFTGVPSLPTFAFNSAATIRVTALHQIGGYNPWFWLDSSDHHMFRQLHRNGMRVFVAGDIEVDHSFSMTDMQARLSPERYRHMLLAESAFWDLEMGTLAGLERTARLIFRVYAHLRRKDSPALRAITCEFLKRRLLWTRRRRLRVWEEETQRRFPELRRSPTQSF